MPARGPSGSCCLTGAWYQGLVVEVRRAYLTVDMVLKGEDLQALGFSDSLYVTSKRIPRSGA